MKKPFVEQLEAHIYRISDRSRESLLLRYGLIPPLPEGKPCIPDWAFECAWDGWQEERQELAQPFAHAGRRQIIGAPEARSQAEEKDAPECCGAEREGFAIRFPVAPEERFYGLGEGMRDHLCLNGKVYQNFTKYQSDEIPIPFLMSSAGWALLILADGKHYVDVNSRNNGFLSVIGYSNELDVLVMRGSSMAELLALYARYTGRSMVLPKWAYGLTYIAPIFATQFDVLRDAENMQKYGIPCQHFSLEPGWMDTFYNMSLNKQWCLERFHMPSWLTRKPEPDTFVSALKRMGIHLSLWTCVDYDFTDEAERGAGRRETNAFEPWYQHLSKLVQTGVDGFKLDPANMLDPYQLTMNHNIDPHGVCANGESYEHMHNLMQLLLPKQVYEGFVQQTGKRPMLHYCGGYTGIQRWCAATTGDNGGQLGAMIWLQTLALSGHSNTTVDMDIFHPESQHFAFFAPWAHLNAWEGVRQPWYAGEKLRDLFVRYARLRSRLLPYIYSAALEAHETGLPIIRPMPLAFEGFAADADMTCQYLFGPSLLVGAYTNELHLPPGMWRDAWTGGIIPGDCRQTIACPEEWGGALLIREGAIIPTQENEKDDELTVHLFPGENGTSCYVLREDDGETMDYQQGAIAHTCLTMYADANGVRLTIGTVDGDYAGRPTGRNWRICLHDARMLTVVLEQPDDTWEQAAAPQGLQL